MSECRQYRCLNCGHRFVVEVLTPEERREAQRRNQPVYSIGCPECQRTNVRLGWD
jgi:hypothetical protein